MSDGLMELLEGIETTSYPGIKKAAEAIATFVPKSFTVILPPAVHGHSQAARRRRRVRLATGAILELPSGSNPVMYLLTNGGQWR